MDSVSMRDAHERNSARRENRMYQNVGDGHDGNEVQHDVDPVNNAASEGAPLTTPIEIVINSALFGLSILSGFTWIAMSALMLSGCAAQSAHRAAPIIQAVNIPVAVPCLTVLPERPLFAANSLARGANIFSQTKALLAEREQHIGYEAELEAALRVCG